MCFPGEAMFAFKQKYEKAKSACLTLCILEFPEFTLFIV